VIASAIYVLRRNNTTFLSPHSFIIIKRSLQSLTVTYGCERGRFGTLHKHRRQRVTNESEDLWGLDLFWVPINRGFETWRQWELRLATKLSGGDTLYSNSIMIAIRFGAEQGSPSSRDVNEAIKVWPPRGKSRPKSDDPTSKVFPRHRAPCPPRTKQSITSSTSIQTRSVRRIGAVASPTSRVQHRIRV